MPFQLQTICSTEWLNNGHGTGRERESGSCGGLFTYSPDGIKKISIQHEQFPNTNMFTQLLRVSKVLYTYTLTRINYRSVHVNYRGTTNYLP
jgi:hypothetical protein